MDAEASSCKCVAQPEQVRIVYQLEKRSTLRRNRVSVWLDLNEESG
jgi:hypothetical protein